MALLSIQREAAFALPDLTTTTSGFGSSDGTSDIESHQAAGVGVQCDIEYRLGLDGGKYLSGTRRLSDGNGHFISYSLWQDAGANIEWGDNGLGTGVPYPAAPLVTVGTGAIVNHSVYATAMTLGASPPGIYIDLIHVTLIWSPYGPTDKLETDLSLSLLLTGVCTLDTGSINGFGTWPADSDDIKGAALGVVTINCTPGLIFTLGVDAGQNFQTGLRHMHKGTDMIPYVLWTDSPGTIPWGDNGLAAVEPAYTETHPAPAITATATGSTQNFFVWGDAMISGKPAGTYSDTVTFTIVWP